MNREILFRGKRIDNGEWVYGSLIITPFDERLILAEGCDYFQEHPVIVAPETVGQYTGFTDKNGTKIFEHDIVRIRGDQNNEDWKRVDYIAQIVFIDGGFCAIDGTIEEYGFRRYGLSRMDFCLEVIGNIHDNPELIGGVGNDEP